MSLINKDAQDSYNKEKDSNVEGSFKKKENEVDIEDSFNKEKDLTIEDSFKQKKDVDITDVIDIIDSFKTIMQFMQTISRSSQRGTYNVTVSGKYNRVFIPNESGPGDAIDDNSVNKKFL